MTTYTITTTVLQAAGLAAACAAYNAAAEAEHDAAQAHLDESDRVAYTPVTPEGYFALRAGDMLDSYVGAHAVGRITVYEFVERFKSRGVYDGIYAAAQTDPMVAALLTELRAKTDPVNLASPKVAGGLEVLVVKGLITSAQAAEIGAI